MKNFSTICLAIIAFFALSGFSTKNDPLTVAQALAEKKIQMSIAPYETYAGDGIQMTITNISGKLLNLKMPMGTLFIPDAEDEQTLIKSEDEMFALSNGQKKILQFHGYCTELHDNGCDVSTVFTMNQTSNTKLRALLSYMDSLQIKDENTIQHAIWCITDSSSVSYIENDKNPATAKSLREYLCKQTGQQDTWYKTASDIVETPQHVFVIVPKKVTGEITFESTEEVRLYGVIKDSTGKILHTSPRVINAPSGVEVTFDFGLTVIGWAPGKYSVVYTNNGVEVIHQEFEI